MSEIRIGIIGHFARSVIRVDGQTIKTNMLYSELCRCFPSDTIIIGDTYRWKQRGVQLLFETIRIMVKCRYVIIIVKDKGLRIFLPLLLLLNVFLRKQIHHVVLGGDLPEIIHANTGMLYFLQAITANYVETASMQKKLKEMGLENVLVMPNFKRLPILAERELNMNFAKPLALCTFSRVSQTKGIEDAIIAVHKVNELMGTTVYTLDIYGQIDEGFRERFHELLAIDPAHIQYKGIIPFDKSVPILQNYFLLLFPTFYVGEGFPGTLIDAFSAGVPVIASDWRYNSELIEDGTDGFIVKAHDIPVLTSKLIEIAKAPEAIARMKKNCLDKAGKFHPDLVISEFLQHMGASK
jgi:glycosyltransferase involved in cell wall biosynthesis